MNRIRKFLGAGSLAVALLGTSACATAQRPAMPHAASWRHAAATALREPDTWLPAAAAVAVDVSGADHRISNWASRETPIFGSTTNAEDMSNLLKGGTHVLMLGTALLRHGDDDSFSRRAGTVVGNELATLPSALITAGAKEAFGRERPDASDDLSFPSGHASVSASYAAVTRTNLELADVNERTRRMIAIAARVLVIGTSWARVEAKKHYPTDVLAGAALGNAITRTVDLAFRGRRQNVAVVVQPERHGCSFLVHVALAP